MRLVRLSVMGKITRLFGAICSIALILTSCASKGAEDVEWKFSEKIARSIQPDGWVYSFEYEYMKSGEVTDGDVPYSFYGYNLRYRYPQNETAPSNQMIQSLETKSPQMKHDATAINEYLMMSKQKSPTELMQKPLDNIDLQELDGDLYERLMKEALEGTPHAEGKYVGIPRYAMLNEQLFIDQYEFQIGFLSNMGCVDVIYIDVLIEDSSVPIGYKQLSDLVENGSATNAQADAFSALQKIAGGIVENNDLMYGADQYQAQVFDNIEFSRLYLFLQNIEELKLEGYVPKI